MIPRRRGRRRGLDGPNTASLLLRIAALLLPLSMVVASAVWRWPDRLLEGSGVALATVQLALGTFLAWGTADAYLRTRRRRLLLARMGGEDDSDESDLHGALRTVWSDRVTRVVVMTCTDEGIDDVVRIVRRSARSTGRVAWDLRPDAVARLCGCTDRVTALAILRGEFIVAVMARGFKESEAVALWEVLLHRTDLVAIARSPGTMDTARMGTDLLRDLAEAGVGCAWVGSSHPLGRDHGLLEFDTGAALLAAGHLREETVERRVDPLDGTDPLLDILGDRVLATESIRAKLLVTSRLKGQGRIEGIDRDQAAGALIVEPGYFDDTERRELVDILQFSSRGIRILGRITEPVEGSWNPPVLDGPGATGFLAHKRRFCLAPGTLSDERVRALCTELPSAWLLDIIASTRATTTERARILLLLAEAAEVSVRYAAAVQLVKTLSLQDPASLLALVDSRIPDAPVIGLDADLGLGAVGWIAPRLVVEWPDACAHIWTRLLAAAARRDPAHLGLSIARGILLVSGDHPAASSRMIAELRAMTPLFWLSEIKLAHAAGKIAVAGDADGEGILRELTDSPRALVAEAARLAREGVRTGRPVAEWTWGLEMLETLSTRHEQDSGTTRLLGRVVIEYGSFVSSVTSETARERALDTTPPATAPARLPLRWTNPEKKSEIRLGPVFCLRQARMADDARMRRTWSDAAREALSTGNVTGGNLR